MILMKTVLKTLALVATFAGFVSCGSNPLGSNPLGSNPVPKIQNTIPDVIPDLSGGGSK